MEIKKQKGRKVGKIDRCVMVTYFEERPKILALKLLSIVYERSLQYFRSPHF